MLLVERGKILLSEPVATYLPEFGKNGKEAITVEQLLTHQSGLIADNPLGDYKHGADEAWRRIWELKPQSEPGSKFIYSDVNFLVLGKLVETVSGKPLAEFAKENIYAPLEMSETGFLPVQELRERAAPSEQRDGQWLKGEVHDPRSALLGGVAGHAGLFSTADDLAVYVQMMLGKGYYSGTTVLSPATIADMTRPRMIDGKQRALGWDVRTSYSVNRGNLLSPRAFGHGGFTGTAMWIDPELKLFVIFLSNRLHPDGKGIVNPLAGRIGNIAAAALRTPPVPRESVSNSEPVILGIDALAEDGFRPLRGKRVGLITNHTGLNAVGERTVDLLHKAKEVNLVASRRGWNRRHS
jgi:CubicO group peptidase (beta-lactamase class C family)